MRAETTKAQIREDAARRAAESFGAHELHEESPTLWRCARSGTSMYSYRVASLPGALAVYGDIGDLMLRPGAIDPIPWVRSSVHSLDYLLSKMPVRRRRHKRFYPELANRVLREWVEGEQGERSDSVRAKREAIAEEIREEWTVYSEDDGEAFNRAWCEHVGDSEALEVVWYWDFCELWCAEGLRWFVRAIEQIDGPNERTIP